MDPSINKSKWSHEEDVKIVKLFCIHGNSWSNIAKEVDGRTNDAIKNRFNSNLSKKLHEEPFSNILDEFIRQKAESTESDQAKDDISSRYTPLKDTHSDKKHVFTPQKEGELRNFELYK